MHASAASAIAPTAFAMSEISSSGSFTASRQRRCRGSFTLRRNDHERTKSAFPADTPTQPLGDKGLQAFSEVTQFSFVSPAKSSETLVSCGLCRCVVSESVFPGERGGG